MIFSLNQKSLWDDYRFKYKLERQRGDQNMFPHSSPLLSRNQHYRSFVKRYGVKIVSIFLPF